MSWFIHGCPFCGGDLHDDLEDPGWVTCFLCARSFRASELQSELISAVAPARDRPRPRARGKMPIPTKAA